MLQSEANKFTEKCFNGEPASCTYACPYHFDVRSFLKKAARGRWDSCYKDLMNALAFPSVACSICGKKCQDICQRAYIGDDPISVNDIEFASIEYAKTHVPETYAGALKAERIAVIGAGVCGLSAAFMLSQKQYTVDIYEKTNEIGGSLKSHKDFDIFAMDFASKFKTTRVQFHLADEIYDIETMRNYDAVLIATGKDSAFSELALMRDRNTYMTKYNGIFACGEICRATISEAMAEGLAVANYMEAYILSGKPDFGVQIWKKEHCTRIVEHDGVEHTGAVPKTGDIFTKDEAKREAARCMQCNCDSCLNVCEFMKKYKKTPIRFANDVYMDSQVRPPITSHTATKAVYSCNLCGRCKDVCPVETDLPGLFCFSRQNRYERGDYPPAFHYFWIRNQLHFSGEAAFELSPNDEPCSYAFFPGCQLGASNPEYVIRAYEFLRENYDAGIIASCCGAPSYWAGASDILSENTQKIRDSWENLGKPTLVTACTSCTKMLKMILPEIKTVSLYTLLDEKGVSGDLSEYETVSVFDPCSVYATPSVMKSVRSIASRCKTNVSDYDSGGKCCGNGGHIRLADPELFGNITRNRAEDSEFPYLVYCANCREIFKSKGKDCRHILEAVFGIDGGDTPNLDEKMENGLMVKASLLEKYKNIKFVKKPQPWDDIKTDITPSARAHMEDKLITDFDVRQTIWYSEENSTGFENPDTGVTLCFLARKTITYWVEFRKNGEVYEILDAYCHRMHFRDGEDYNG